MYKVYLNIGSITTPVSGTGWVEMSCEVDEATITKAIEQEEIFARVELQGKLTFMFNEFDAIDTLRLVVAKVPVKVTHTPNSGSESTIYEGELNLRGTYDENRAELSASPDDMYTDLLTGKTKKVNIINVTPEIKCDVLPRTGTLVFFDSSESQTALWTTFTGTEEAYAREEIIKPDIIADALDGTLGWAIIEDFGNGVKKLARTWVDGGFDVVVSGDLIYYPTNGDPGYSLNDQEIISGVQCTLVGTYATGSYPGFTWVTVWLNNEVYYEFTTITFSRFHKLTSIIKGIVNEFDTTIQFDESSWSYLNAHDELKHLLIINVSDLIPDSITGIEEVEGQEISELTFDKLMTMLRTKLKLYWLLEDVGGVPYFRLKHRSEVNYSVGAIDVTDLQDFDWSPKLWKYTDEKLFNRLQRETTGINYDFIGNDILIPTLDNIAEPKQIADEKWHFDVWDVIARGASFYSSGAKDEFVMLAAEVVDTDSVEQLSSMNNVLGGYESFSYAAGTLTAANTAAGALAQSNSITPPSKGYTYKIVLNLTASTGQKPIVNAYGTDLQETSLADGVNTLYASAGSASFELEIKNTLPASFTIEDMSITRCVYNCRVGVGAFTGEKIANADLSVANLDEGHAQYELPDRVVNINLRDVTLTDNQITKYKEQVINCPLHSPDDIAFDELFVSNKGNLEFDSLKIPLKGSMPELIGRFL